MNRKAQAYSKAIQSIKLAKQKVSKDVQMIQAAEKFIKKAQFEGLSEHFDNEEAACRNCDESLSASDNFCSNCGAQASEEERKDSLHSHLDIIENDGM